MKATRRTAGGSDLQKTSWEALGGAEARQFQIENQQHVQ